MFRESPSRVTWTELSALAPELRSLFHSAVVHCWEWPHPLRDRRPYDPILSTSNAYDIAGDVVSFALGDYGPEDCDRREQKSAAAELRLINKGKKREPSPDDGINHTAVAGRRARRRQSALRRGHRS